MNPAWPEPSHERLLDACFAPEPEAAEALDECSRLWPPRSGDSAAMQLLPLVYRRHAAAGGPLVEAGHKAYLAAWVRNRERMAALEALAAEFDRAGIHFLALKGVALVLAHYHDAGLRGMSDFDVLIERRDLARASAALERLGYRAEGGAGVESLVRQARVRHGWQFFLGECNCDLHWRPLARANSPEIARIYRDTATRECLAGREIEVPCASVQFFHVAVHGVQWNWTPQIRWVADALTVAREPLDWELIGQLAGEAQMHVRLARALRYLSGRFAVPAPAGFAERLERAAPGWERREYDLLLRPCPLGPLDSVLWHALHFRRLRPHDPAWSHMPAPAGFAQYLAAFLDASGWREGARRLWPEVRARLSPARRAPR
jgi:hypothetical protein